MWYPSSPLKAFCLIALLSATIAPAQAASPLEKNFYLSGPRYDGALPECAAALSYISKEFSATQSEFWANNVAIVGYENVREVAYSPWAAGTIPRRFCRAIALVSDAHRPDLAYRRHLVNFSIGEDTGFASFRWGVEWCVTGYDLEWAYKPHCKMAGP